MPPTLHPSHGCFPWNPQAFMVESSRSRTRWHRKLSDDPSTQWKVHPSWYVSGTESPVNTISTSLDYIWVNYNISPTWIKAIWGWFPLLTMIPVRENSEVVIIYPDYINSSFWRFFQQGSWLKSRFFCPNPRALNSASALLLATWLCFWVAPRHGRSNVHWSWTRIFQWIGLREIVYWFKPHI